MKIPNLDTIMKRVLLTRTQVELSKMTGISQGNISSYSHGVIEPNFKNSVMLIEIYYSDIEKDD